MGEHRLRGKIRERYREHLERIDREYSPERLGVARAAYIRKILYKELWFMYDKAAEWQCEKHQEEW